MKLHITMLLLVAVLNLKSQLDSSYRILDKEAAFYKAYFANNKLKVLGLKIEKNGKQSPFSVQIGPNLKSSNSTNLNIGQDFAIYNFSENAIDKTNVVSAFDFYNENRNFFKFDSLGNMIFHLKISKDTILYISKLIQTRDSGCLIAGYLFNSTYTYTTPLIKINAKGKIEWVKNYSLRPYYDILGYGLYEINGAFYLLISKEKKGLSSPAIFDNNYAIYKIAANGDSLKSWIGNRKDISVGGSDLYVDKDENIIFSGNRIDSVVLDTPNRERYYLKRTYLCAIDKSNKLIWEKTIGETSSVWTYISKIKQLKDGNILAVGMNYNITKKDYCYYGYVVKMTKSGQIIWEKNYKTSFLSSSNRDNFEDFIELDDESIIIVGSNEKVKVNDTTTNPIYNRKFGWVVRLNKNGEVLKDANSNIEIVALEDFNIYPNPSSNSIQISKEISSNSKSVINIYSLDGRLQMSNSIELYHSVIDIQKLPKGIYQIELIDDDKSYYKKLIKE